MLIRRVQHLRALAVMKSLLVNPTTWLSIAILRFCHHHHHLHGHHHDPNQECLPWTVGEIEGKGRVVIATRDIKPRQVLHHCHHCHRHRQHNNAIIV